MKLIETEAFLLQVSSLCSHLDMVAKINGRPKKAHGLPLKVIFDIYGALNLSTYDRWSCNGCQRLKYSASCEYLVSTDSEKMGCKKCRTLEAAALQ